MKRRRKKTKRSFFSRKKLMIFLISFFVILIGFVAVMGLGGLFSGYENDEEIAEPVDKETGKINILLAGTDVYGACTDTIMVVSYDLDKNAVNILSVPRDTRMYIGNKYQKVNAAYSISENGKRKGIQGTIEAVTRLAGIPINYYVEFTFEAFRNAIDALGGVDFYVPQNMNYEDPVQSLYIHLKEGQQHLDGNKAEQLVRFRRYPMGDIDRVKVQQSFIKALAEQKLNAGIITKLPDLFEVIKEDLKTNFKLSDVSKYALNLLDLSADNVYMHELPGTPNSTDYGASYWIADMTALAEIIEQNFEYDASGITIHSADGSSKAKDIKTTAPSATPTPRTEATHTPTPSIAATPTARPTKTPEATAAAPTVKPAETHTPTPSATTPAPTAKSTVEPTKTPTPEQGGIKRPSANPDAE